MIPIHPRLYAAGFALLTAYPVSAQVVPLVNPGAESPDLVSGSVPGVSGWSGDTTLTAVGADLMPPVTPTEGDQLVFADSPAGNNFLMFQVTTESIEANQIYNLSLDVYPLVDDPVNSSLGIEMSPNPSFGGFLASRYWRSNNFATEFPFAPFPGPDTIMPVAGQWNRVNMGFNTANFPAAVGDNIQITIRGHKFAIDNVLLTKGAASYYVSSSSGSDMNDGLTPATAWQTFTNLSGRELAPGSEVRLMRGDTWPNSELRLSGKGTSTDPITLGAYGVGPDPVITGVNLTDAACVVLENPSHFVVENLDLRDAKIGLYLRYAGGNTDATGPMFNNENVTITGCNFRNMDEEWSDASGEITVVDPFELSWGAGIWIGGNIPAPPGGPWASETAGILDGLTITHCSFQETSTGVGNGWYFPPVFRSRITNVVMEDLWVTGCENGSFALFYVDGAQIERVDAYNGGTGFYDTGTTAGFLQHCINMTIENCEFAFNFRNDTGADGVGFDFEGNTENMIFRDNVIHNNDGGGLLILDSPSPSDNFNLTMEDNTFWNNVRNPPATSGSQNKALRYPNTGSTGSFANNGVYLGTNVGSGTLEAFDSTTRWGDFTSAVGTTRVSTWASVSGRPDAWSFGGGVEGWGNENQWTGFGASGGALTGTSSGVDPFAESADTWVNTRANEWVSVTMSQTAGANAQVFFQTETDPTWTADKSVAFPIVADGSTQTYVVDMTQSAEYRGVVTKWRLDPTDASGSVMVIEDFSSRPDPYLATVMAVSATEVDVTFNMPMLPQSGMNSPANYSLSGAGAGTLTANPDTVTKLMAPGGPVYRLTWNGGATTGDPATLTVSNVENSRGVAIGSANTASFTTVAGPSSISDWFLID